MLLAGQFISETWPDFNELGSKVGFVTEYDSLYNKF